MARLQSIVGAGLATVGAGLATVGAGLATKACWSLITEKQNPPWLVTDNGSLKPVLIDQS
jgi:hypothetical protein